MAKNALGFTIDDDGDERAPLTAPEKAAVRRAEADIKAGRLHEHSDVAKWLRRRAVDIVERTRRLVKQR